MAGEEKAVGQRGIIRIDIEQVSQNPSANQSNVRVLCQIRLSSGGPSGDLTGNCKRSVTGDVSWGPSSYTFENLYTSWFTVIDNTWTVSHNSDGTKTVNATFNFGPTITQNLGSGGSVSASLTLTPIAKLPGKTAITSGYYNSPYQAVVTWNAASSGSWDPIQEYQIDWWPTDNSGIKTYVSTSGSANSATINVSGSSSGYSFRVRGRNSKGWGEWSDAYSLPLSNVATAPRNLTISFNSQTIGTISYSAPSSMGSGTFEKYQIEWDTRSDFATRRMLETENSSRTFSGFSPGQTVYARVRAVTSSGQGYWSGTVSAVAPSGPSVKVGTAWRPTIAYVRDGGVWKVAVPYIYINGEWRLAAS